MAHPLRRLITTIGSPPTLHGKEGRYELAAFYGDLLGMKIINEGWLLIAEDRESKTVLALDGDGWSDERPPRWPDPEYPQQMHLDILVPDVDATGVQVAARGAGLLQENDGFKVYADPAGHPFCLYPDPSATAPRIGRIVVDCFSPRSLASFYEGLLESSRRIGDTQDRVVLDLDDDELPHLAFQQAQFVATRWPDPAYPAQLHIDYRWNERAEGLAAKERAERFGAIRLPRPADTEVYADPAGHPFCLQIQES